MSDNAQQLEIVKRRQRLELLRRRKQLREENGLAFYTPHPKQDTFHRAAKYKRRYLRTGNRFGKSDCGAAEDCAYALGERPWYSKDDPARYAGIPKHSTKGCIIVQDWDKAHEIFTNTEPGKSRGKLFHFLPKDAIVSCKKGRSGTGIAEIVIRSVHGGHSTIHLETVRSFMQNKMGLESSNWDWIHVDEPCPREMWVAVSRGLVDRAGSAWFTCTPITEAWINDYFIPRSLTRSTFDEGYKNVETENLTKYVLTGSSYDNPHISKEALQAFEADISADERECRISGIPAALAGVVYKEFSQDIHVYRDCPKGWEDVITPPRNYTIRVFIDPHPKTPHAVSFFATSPEGYTFQYQELFRPGLISDICEHIKAVVDGYVVEDFICDPIAWNENPIDGTCMADVFYEQGLNIVPAVKDLAYGIQATRKKLRDRDEADRPTFYVHEGCDTFLFEIDRYVWKPNTEKPVDKDDHMMENLYRAVLSGMKYVEPGGYKLTVNPINLSSTKNILSGSLGLPTMGTPSLPKQQTSNRYRV